MTTNKIILTFILLSLSIYVAQAQENNALLCADGIDNDGDGLIDCEDDECVSIPNFGCATCGTGLSFADVVLDYQSGCPAIDQNPEGAIGVADYWGNNLDEPEFVFLGEGGFIKLGFTDNLISNSGDNQNDVYVFEVGPAVESTLISLRPFDAFTETQLINNGIPDLDGDGYYFISGIGGATASLDIDAVLPGYPSGTLYFDAIELMDLDDIPCTANTPGADIDAVCAIYSVDCNGVQNGTAVFDACGDCLELSDPDFNQACADCLGIPDGLAILDECGDCYLPDDPLFNQACTDCMGVVNGTAIIDECGDCYQPDDPAIDQACIDCLGTPNGQAIIDECGDCYLPDDPDFNQACADCEGTPNGMAVLDTCGICLNLDNVLFNLSCYECDIYIPNVFSPDENGNNDHFKIFTCTDYEIDITKFTIFDRWGNRLHEQTTRLSIDEFEGWDGRYNDEKLNPGVYTYIIEIINHVDKIFVRTGTVTLIR